MTLEKLKQECWCDYCNDYIKPRLNRWETSIAVIEDWECPICGEILNRIPRVLFTKKNSPPAPNGNEEKR